MNELSAEELHRAVLASIGMVFGQIATIDEVLGKLRTSVPLTSTTE